MPRPSPRAKRFAALLDGSAGRPAERARQTAASADQDLVALTTRLSTLPVGVPPRQAAVRTATLGALAIVAAEVARHAADPAAHVAPAAHVVPAAPARTAARRAGQPAGPAGHTLLAAAHGTLLAALTGVTALVVATAAVGTATHRSIPGDPLYGLKRTVENLQQEAAGGGTAGAHQRLGQATTRLSEIRALERGPTSAVQTARIDALISALDEDVAAATGPLLAAGPAAVAELRSAVATLRDGLTALPATATIRRSVALLAGLWNATGVPAAPPATGAGTAGGTAPTSGSGGTGGRMPSPTPTHAPATAPPAVLPTVGAPATGVPQVTQPPAGASSGPAAGTVVPPTPTVSILPTAPTPTPTPTPTPIASIVSGLLSAGS